MLKEHLNVFKITMMKGPHTCTNASLNQRHKQLNSEYLSEEVFSLVKADLKINIAAIQAHAETHLGYSVSYRQAWTAKQKVMEKLFGTFEESYNVLPRFFHALQISNPGSVVNFHHKEVIGGAAVFERVFWAFAPCIVGFQFCRRLISIDGTHLYGKYKGKLLIAVAFDANNGLFPLCYALVDNENNSNWEWFIDCIRTYVTDRAGICELSDRHASIKGAMRERWPEPLAYHRFCSRHFVSNFMDKFKDTQLKEKFDLWMSRMKTYKPEAWTYLQKDGVEKWALSYDDGHRYGNMTTNMSEIFNSVLEGGRFLPVTALVQLTFYLSNKYFVMRRIEVGNSRAEGREWPPQVLADIFRERESSKRQHVRMFNHNPPTFHITTRVRRTDNNQGGVRCHVVCLLQGSESCSCNMWRLYHRPCSHVFAACSAMNIGYSHLMEDYFTLSAYANCYRPTFYPIPDETQWPEYTGPRILPDPDLRRSKKSRPKSTRLTNGMDMREAKSHYKCSICHQSGHNKKHHTNSES
ncbi:uncharacterized protein LOC120007236 [Tripterygium wilfordii]|uniref:uncharacterized protein LOC120007236 n=1 Tax=Tripterygium wilfordii TaxID=458696 RepID=UPI0018F844C9|nr:uncharacterized protein LOC120007236 [Tripterygium wilfordii]